MSLGQIIREKRKQLKLTLDEVADVVGFSKPYLSTIETGKVKNPPSDDLLFKLEKVLKFEAGLLLHIAHISRMPADVRRQIELSQAENEKLKIFVKNLINKKTDDTHIEDMLAESDISIDNNCSKLKSGRLIPIINKLSAGYPEDFDDLDYPAGIADDYVRCPDLHDPNAFAVRVIGDSMEVRFVEGDIVVFSPSADVRNGDDCFVRFKEPHETTFKRIFFEQDGKVRLQPRNDNYSPMIIVPDRINGIYRAVRKIQEL